MRGYIYIAGSFETVNRSTCGQKGSAVDNDPHFWTQPPTWGICRNDLRATAKVNDVVFFVLPKKGRHPQSIFGYITIERIVTHFEAYQMPHLISKRMENKTPNGNIIVNSSGGYNQFDDGAHEGNFDKIKRHYAIGNVIQSRFLTHEEICKLAPSFVVKISQTLGKSGSRPIDIISRKGALLSSSQVANLLAWINQ